ncbi:MAG: META domain-containing protein [Bacteroidota bacterium]
MKPSILLIFSLLTLLNCKTSQLKPINLDGTTWQLKNMIKESVAQSVSLSFKGDKIEGESFCNQYFSNYEAGDGKISIEAVGATKRSCPLMNMEQQFFELLTTVNTYRMKDGELYLQSEQGNLIFEPSK